MKNKIKQSLAVAILVFSTGSANAACTVGASKYIACKPGYYLGGLIFNQSCVQCPAAGKDVNGNDVFGITPDRNTGGITSCKAPQGTYKNDNGVFEIVGDCSYSFS